LLKFQEMIFRVSPYLHLLSFKNNIMTNSYIFKEMLIRESGKNIRKEKIWQAVASSANSEKRIIILEKRISGTEPGRFQQVGNPS